MQPIKIIILALIFVLTNSIAFSQCYSNEQVWDKDSSKINDKHIRLIDSQVIAIDSFINRNRKFIQFDTIEVEVSYTIYTTDSTLICPYSNEKRWYSKDALVRQELWAKKNDSIKNVIFVSLNNEILKIDLNDTGGIPLNEFLLSQLGQIQAPILYFSNNQLIFSTHFCNQPMTSMGRCSGVYSYYSNYFIENKYYGTIIKTNPISFCGCGSNYIIPKSTIDSWLLELKSLK